MASNQYFKLLYLILAALTLFNYTHAQASISSPTGYQSCSALTSSSCPGGSGCCAAGSCCGSGCCKITEFCVNAGTSSAGCCPFGDKTDCGTRSATNSNSGSGSSGSGSGSSGSGSTGSGSGTSGAGQCTAVSNCYDSNRQWWPCLLGQTCTLTYRQCNPCPYLLTGGGSSGSGSSGSGSSGSGSSGSGSSGSGGSSSGSGSSSSVSSSGTSGSGGSSGGSSSSATRHVRTWYSMSLGLFNIMLWI